MAFFLNSNEKKKYEEKHGEIKPKKKRKTGTTSSKGVSKKVKGLNKSLSNKFEFIDSSTGTVVTTHTYFTEDGLRSVIIYENNRNSYTVKILGDKYQVLKEEFFEEIEECKSFISKEIVEIEDSSLVNIIRDVLTRINLLDSEYLFLYKLLVDPEQRSKYELAEIESKPKGKTKSTHSKKKNNLDRLGSDLRAKIKGA